MKHFQIFLLLFISFHTSVLGQQNNFEWSDTTFEIGDKREIFYYLDHFDNTPIIDTITYFLKENPNLKIKVHSYTDPRVSRSYSINVAEKRVIQLVKNLLLNEIPKIQIEFEAYEDTIPFPDREKRYKFVHIEIIETQLPIYYQLLEKDSLVQSYYFKQLDYFRFSKEHFQQEFDSLADYFQKVLEFDSTLVLAVESQTDARGSNRYSYNPNRRIFEHLNLHEKIDDNNKIKIGSFYPFINSEDRGKVLIQIKTKAAYEANLRESILPKGVRVDKCKGCPF